MSLSIYTTKRLATALLSTTILLLQLTSAATTPQPNTKRHVQLVTPQPFVWAEYGPTNPLAPDGSDYPCKVPHSSSDRIAAAFQIQANTPTVLTAGEAQTVSFSGTAVHGGGSCQFALTEGHAPTNASVWKVIHSVEGGCPKANVSGNLEAGESPDTYSFTVPEEDFAPGEYTWAWTWVNRISGGPEFYMNCAPITVVAGGSKTKNKKRGGKKRATRTYPDLFLANIGEASNGCDTAEAVYSQIAIAYPYPGDSISYPNGQGNLFPQACDGNPRNNGSAAAADASSADAAPSTTPASTAFVASSAPSSASLSIETVPNETTPTATATATMTAATPTDGAICTDGYLMCVGGTQFSTCTGGAWTAPQSLGEDVTCVEQGESEGLETTYHYEE